MEEPTARPRRLSDLRLHPLKVAFSQPETVGPGLGNTGQGVKRFITASDDEDAHLLGSAHLSGSASSLRAVPHTTRFARQHGTRSKLLRGSQRFASRAPRSRYRAGRSAETQERAALQPQRSPRLVPFFVDGRRGAAWPWASLPPSLRLLNKQRKAKLVACRLWAHGGLFISSWFGTAFSHRSLSPRSYAVCPPPSTVTCYQGGDCPVTVTSGTVTEL